MIFKRNLKRDPLLVHSLNLWETQNAKAQTEPN